jgi:putative membrane protein
LNRAARSEIDDNDAPHFCSGTRRRREVSSLDGVGDRKDARDVFLHPDGERRLGQAIAVVEARSRVELVVVVRSTAGHYLGNDMLVASAAALAMLAFQLYSALGFEPFWLLIHPPLVGAVVIALLRLVPSLRAMFVGEAQKQEAVDVAAAAWFHRKGIRHTRERTGLLIFVAVFEKHVAVVPDTGISQVIPLDVWRDAVEPLEQVLRNGGDASTLATRLLELGDVLARWCEPRAADRDEVYA